MDFSKLKTSDWLIGGGTLAYLIFMFLNWHSKSEGNDFGRVTLTQNGWSYLLGGILPLLLLLAAAALALLPKFQPSINLPERIGPLTRAQAILVGAGAAAVIVLLRLVIPAEVEFLGVDTGVDYDRAIGLFLAFIAAAAATAGAFMKYQGTEEGPGATPSGPATPF